MKILSIKALNHNGYRCQVLFDTMIDKTQCAGTATHQVVFEDDALYSCPYHTEQLMIEHGFIRERGH